MTTQNKKGPNKGAVKRLRETAAKAKGSPSKELLEILNKTGVQESEEYKKSAMDKQPRDLDL